MFIYSLFKNLADSWMTSDKHFTDQLCSIYLKDIKQFFIELKFNT